jgi:hypothetical protein
LDDAAFIQQHNAIGKKAGLGHVVGDHYNRLLQALENFLQLILQTGTDHRIKRAKRLIEQQHRRLKHERAHQAHPLPLAAGEFDWIT